MARDLSLTGILAYQIVHEVPKYTVRHNTELNMLTYIEIIVSNTENGH